MNIKNSILVCICFLSLFGGYCQKEVKPEDVINDIRLFIPVHDKKILTSNAIRTNTKELLLWQNKERYKHQKNTEIFGRFLRIDSLSNDEPLVDKVIRKHFLGDYLMFRKNKNDSILFKYYNEALTISLASENTLLVCESLRRILFYLYSNKEKNLAAFQKYLSIYEENTFDEFERAWWIYFNQGYKMTRNFYKKDSILLRTADYLKGVDYARKINNALTEAKLLQVLGVKHDLFENNNDSALFYYKKAHAKFLKDSLLFAKQGRFDLLMNIGTIYHENAHYKEAIKYYYRALKNPLKSKNLSSNVLLYDWMAKSYNQIQNKDSAYIALRLHLKFMDSLNKANESMKIKELEKKYQTATKEKQILEEKQRANTNRNWLIAAILALVIGTGVAFLLQKNTLKKRQLAEKETQLKQQRVENLIKAQELMSIDAMIEGQEKERQRVANELHDDLGSLMATLKLHLDRASVSNNNPSLQSAEKLLEEAYQKIRGIAHSKNSGVISNQGLLPAIKKMAHVISETNAVALTVEDFGTVERLENSMELNLFRMIQELVANAIKHAQGTKISIQLTQHTDHLNIIIEDDGKGFDRREIQSTNTGMGLTNIEKRVEHLEGSFIIDSVVGKGTSIIIDIPV